MSEKNRFKFRVWDNNFKKYRNGLAIQNSHVCTYDDNACILEQCTGLKDKNGKLIYEGDIVRTKLGDVQEITFISQDIEDGVVRTFVSLSRKPPHLMAMANSDEIIGNIHENPELLEVD